MILNVMIKYKKLINLFRNNDYPILTFNEMFLYRKIYSPKKKRAISFKLEDSARMEAATLFAEAICETKKSREKYRDIIMRYSGLSCGILNRMFIRYQNGKLTSTYCAGQDYPSEIKCVQKILREGA